MARATLDVRKQKLKKEYDKQASLYDVCLEKHLSIKNRAPLSSEWVRGMEAEDKNFIRLANPKSGEVALDMACGTGRVFLKLVEKRCIVHGIDISEKMLSILKRKIAERRISNSGEIAIGSIEKTGYNARYFDLVTCMGAMDYYPLSFARKVLSEAKRVLKPEGRVVIDFPLLGGELFEEFKKGEEKDGIRVYAYPQEKIEKAIQKSGLKIKKIVRAGMEFQFLLKKR
ncbi:Ubiquinone/menaquinone biosynthesis C-methyltransferase UbiE [uncultured archaeon]|nr:Ubiquinone/menaquinone biosynthesis C-methyltransferase UbiE [uncultured archaeon]